MEEFADWQGLARGEENAWNAFYRSHSPLLRWILSQPKWGFTREEQEEMLQEILISLLHAVKSYRGDAKLSTFVTNVARNNCVSAIRRRLSHKRGDGKTAASLEEIEMLHTSDEPSVADELVAREEREMLQRAMDRLEPACRDLIRSRYFEERTFQELSDESGEPIGTLATRLKKCLLLLKSLYEVRPAEGKR